MIFIVAVGGLAPPCLSLQSHCLGALWDKIRAIDGSLRRVLVDDFHLHARPVLEESLQVFIPEELCVIGLGGATVVAYRSIGAREGSLEVPMPLDTDLKERVTILDNKAHPIDQMLVLGTIKRAVEFWAVFPQP